MLASTSMDKLTTRQKELLRRVIREHYQPPEDIVQTLDRAATELSNSTIELAKKHLVLCKLRRLWCTERKKLLTRRKLKFLVKIDALHNLPRDTIEHWKDVVTLTDLKIQKCELYKRLVKIHCRTITETLISEQEYQRSRREQPQPKQ